MALRAGMIGLPGCGKTAIFNAVTAAGVAAFGRAELNRAVVAVPDDRLEVLSGMYQPLKTVPATLEVVDIPGLAAGSTSFGGRGNRLLGHVKDVDALIHVVRFFPGTESIDPQRDTEIVDLEMVAADAQTVENKIERLLKKSRTGDKEAIRELELCRKVAGRLQEGIPARRQNLSEAEQAAVYECHLASLKPVVYVANVAGMEDAEKAEVGRLKALAAGESAETVVVSGRDEADLAELEPDERKIFMQELGITESSTIRLIRAAYRLLGLITFFTTGPDECRAWTCRRGDPAPTAAGKIHSDMEQGFIRMEVIRYGDLIDCGSEEAAAKAGLRRLEGKEYQVADGDIVVVRFSS